MSNSDLRAHFEGDQPAVSFELFPPKNEAKQAELFDHVDHLMQFSPAFFTCTYGAGGSTRSKTLGVVEELKKRTKLPVASHLTCVGSTREQLTDYLQSAISVGTDYIVALRGDPPKGSEQFEATEGGLHYANELVELINEVAPQLGTAVAGYPEVHQEAPDRQTDMVNLKRKVDAGAGIVVTQLFYDNDDFYRFRDDCEKMGIDVPIVPGILPVTNYKQAKKIAGMCKARIPDSLASAMEVSDEAADQFEVGVEHARQQVIDLTNQGVPGIHFYVLNRSDAALQLLSGLGFAAV